MEVIPIKINILKPPQDNLLEALSHSDLKVKEGDVVAISSKVVAIHEGSCVPVEGADKQALVENESDLSIPRDYWGSPLTVVHNAFIGTAGIDESNADGYFVKLPKDPFQSAIALHKWLRETYEVDNVGVIITDSHSVPLRRGAMGISIGFFGFKPTIDHVGEADLFGREMKIEVSNLVDGLAAAATVVMGETDEAQPVAVLRGVPTLTFTEETLRNEAYVEFAEDTYRVLYERFLP